MGSSFGNCFNIKLNKVEQLTIILLLLLLFVEKIEVLEVEQSKRQQSNGNDYGRRWWR